MRLSPEWTIALILGAWVLIAVLGEPLRELLRSISQLLTALFNGLANAASMVIASIPPASETLRRYARDFWGAIESLLDRVLSTLNTITTLLQSHGNQVLSLLPSSSNSRGLHMFGYLLYLIAFAAFAFADVAQATNSRSVMYVDLQVPAILQDLTIPLLIASGGTALMLGTILGDFLAKTDLVPWCTLPRWARGIISFVVLITFLFTLILMVLIAMVRVPEMVPGILPISVAQQLHTMAAFSDSLVIIPLLVTTLLLFWGMFGLLVLYYFLIGALFLGLRLLGFVLALLKLACPMLGNACAALIGLLNSLFSIILAMLKWLCETLNLVQGHIFELLEKTLDVIIYPIVRPAQRVSRYFRQEGA